MNTKVFFKEKTYFNYSQNRFAHPVKIDGIENVYTLCFTMTSKLDELTYLGDGFLLFDPNKVLPIGTKFYCELCGKLYFHGEFV